MSWFYSCWLCSKQSMRTVDFRFWLHNNSVLGNVWFADVTENGFCVGTFNSSFALPVYWRLLFKRYSVQRIDLTRKNRKYKHVDDTLFWRNTKTLVECANRRNLKTGWHVVGRVWDGQETTQGQYFMWYETLMGYLLPFLVSCCSFACVPIATTEISSVRRLLTAHLPIRAKPQQN